MPTKFEFVGALFADIEGFSKLVEDEVVEFTEEVLPALATRVIDPHRGQLIDLNTWGDAIFATSKDPEVIARLALDLRDFFVQRSHEPLYEKLRIRIALHFPRVHIAKNRIPGCGKYGCFGSELTRPARIEPVTPPNTIFLTEALATEINSRKNNMTAVPFKEVVYQAKRAGPIRVFSLHRGMPKEAKKEAARIDWQDPLKRLEAVAPMLVDSWFVGDRRRHNEVEARLNRCRKRQQVRFIAVTGRSIIFPMPPVPNTSITKVSAVARAIDKGVCVRGVVLDRKCREATFRMKIEENKILARDAKCIEGIPTNSDWDVLKEKVRTNLLLRKTRRGLAFNLWLFDDRAIIEPYHFGKRSNEPHMCKFSQFTIFKARDEEYRMLEKHFENLWDDGENLWPELHGTEPPQC